MFGETAKDKGPVKVDVESKGRSVDDADEPKKDAKKKEEELAVEDAERKQKFGLLPQRRAIASPQSLKESPSKRIRYDAGFASSAVPDKDIQLARVSNSPGFLSAFDESENSAPQVLSRYGISMSEYADKEEMMDKMHAMRTRIFTNSKYHGDRVIGAIMFVGTMDRQIRGKPSAQYLWEDKKVIPFVRIDKGLADEANGCQGMKEIPNLDELLSKVVAAAVFGTKTRTVIKLANEVGIQAVVDQQFQIAKQVLAHNLVPILELEVGIKSPEKGKCEELLLKALLTQANKLAPDQKIMYKLTLPCQRNLYTPLVKHKSTLRVVALSGGYNRKDSCQILAEQHGMIASFGRAFTEGLSAQQAEEEFTNTIDRSCEMIYQASQS